jgi:hypothetical protein
MSTPEIPTYEDSDEEADAAGEAAISYILLGQTEGLLLEFIGLKVFATISALRTHDEELHGSTSTLSPKQESRRDEIETDIDRSVAQDLHYYPFGHKRSKTDIGNDRDTSSLKGRGSTWNTKVRVGLSTMAKHAEDDKLKHKHSRY